MTDPIKSFNPTKARDKYITQISEVGWVSKNFLFWLKTNKEALAFNLYVKGNMIKSIVDSFIMEHHVDSFIYLSKALCFMYRSFNAFSCWQKRVSCTERRLRSPFAKITVVSSSLIPCLKSSILQTELIATSSESIQDEWWGEVPLIHSDLGLVEISKIIKWTINVQTGNKGTKRMLVARESRPFQWQNRPISQFSGEELGGQKMWVNIRIFKLTSAVIWSRSAPFPLIDLFSSWVDSLDNKFRLL